MNQTRTALMLALLLALLAGCQIQIAVDPNLFPSATPTDTLVPSVTATGLPTFTATPSPTPTLTPTPTQTPEPTATPMGGGEEVFFDVYGAKSQHLGIFRFNTVTGESSLVGGPELYLVGLSPRRDFLLGMLKQVTTNTYTSLYSIDVADGTFTEIANDMLYSMYDFYGHVQAYWYPSDRIAYVGLGNLSKVINAVKPDTSGKVNLAAEDASPLWILPSSGGKGVCWAAGYARTIYLYEETGAFCTPFDGSAPQPVEKILWNASYSPAGDFLAYISGTDEIRIVSPAGEASYKVPLEKGVKRIYLQSLQWSPDGEKLLFLMSKCTAACNPGVLVLSTEGAVIASLDLETYNVIWSPDGRYLLGVLYKGGSGKGVSEPWFIYNFETGETKILNDFFPSDWAYLQCPLWGNRHCQ